MIIKYSNCQTSVELDIDNPLDYYKNLISYKEYLKNKESFNL